MFLITAFNPLCVALFDAFFIGFAEELAFRGYLFRAFAIIRVKTKSLFWPITAHAFLNFGYELITEHNMKVLEIFNLLDKRFIAHYNFECGNTMTVLAVLDNM